MHSLTLTTDNRDDVAAALAGDRWIVACLCAAWCGTCGSYRATFDQLAERHPDKFFVWIDIEDHADIVRSRCGELPDAAGAAPRAGGVFRHHAARREYRAPAAANQGGLQRRRTGDAGRQQRRTPRVAARLQSAHLDARRLIAQSAIKPNVKPTSRAGCANAGRSAGTPRWPPPARSAAWPVRPSLPDAPCWP